MVLTFAVGLSLALAKPQVASPDQVSGTYRSGWRVVEGLTFAPDGRFRWSRRFCVAVERSQGSWKMDGDRVVLDPDSPAGAPGPSRRFLPIKWGERRYLIEENRMPGFAADARSPRNQSDDFYGDYYFAMEGKDHRVGKVSGAPMLPDWCKEFYELGAIEATVVKINPDRTVVLDRGTNGRLRPGLPLATWDDMDAEVVSVTETTAVARLWYFADSTLGPSVGDIFTTGSEAVAPHPRDEKRYPYLVDVPHRPATGH